MRKIIFATVFSIFFFHFVQAVWAIQGDITKVAYEPEEVVTLSDITITVVTANSDTKTNNYHLKILITHEGIPKYEQSFSFTLEPKKGITFSPTFTPRDVGQFQIIAKLYDASDIELLDSEIITFNAISQVGPFDLKVDLPTKVVRPNVRVPIILVLENKGFKSTDVEVEVKLRCPTGENKESFFVLMEPRSFLERVIALQSCLETGVYDVIGNILLFNRTWISSTSQVIVNSSIIELAFAPPPQLNILAGKSLTFDVMVKNIGTRNLDDLRLVVTRIPTEWIKITPEELARVQPGATGYFLVNITVPSNIQTRLINFTFLATAEDTQIESRSNLQITGLAAAPPTTTKEKPPSLPAITFPKISVPNIFQIVARNLTYVYVIIGIGVAIFVGRILIRARPTIGRRESRQIINYRLEKLKNNISANQRKEIANVNKLREGLTDEVRNELKREIKEKVKRRLI